jgi:predicted secreted Zn-dependent protease
MSLNGFDTRISWRQFRDVSVRPAGMNEDAEIEVEPYLGFRTRTHNGNVEIVDVNTTISVSRQRSWVLNDRKTDWLLNHEQGHFDITALGMRDLYNQLISLSAPSVAELNSQASQMQSAIQSRIDDTNRTYDSQTNHGSNTAEQARWTSRIQAAKTSSSGTLQNL